MKLLAFSLQLRAGSGSSFAVQALPFLGGMLHGAWEDQIYRYAPELMDCLGLSHSQAEVKPTPKRYAMLPPPYAYSMQQQDDGSLHLGFGVILYSLAGDHADHLASAFRRCTYLRLGDRKDTIENLSVQEHTPAANGTFDHLDAICLRWLTPLLLETSGQRTAGAQRNPPALLRVIRSVARRVRELEPSLAEELGLHGSAWVIAEESIRDLTTQSADWQQVSWRYGSRTKDAPVKFSGQLGQVHYFGTTPKSIPANIHALLQWGTWFGAGQRTALGQGFYRIETAT